MVNTIGGKKHKKKANKTPLNQTRQIILKEENQEYAKIIKLLGSGRMTLQCADGEQRIGIVRGAMYKRCWIARDDVVLVGLRDFQDNKADIIHRYAPEEVKELKRLEPKFKDFLHGLTEETNVESEIQFGRQYSSESDDDHPLSDGMEIDGI